MVNDTELLRRYHLEGSQQAFAELSRRHLDLVYSVELRRCGFDRPSAEDVSQVVFRDLVQKAGGLLDRTELAGWLYTSARFASASLVRAEQRRRRRETKSMMMGGAFEGDAPEDVVALRPFLDESIDALAEPDRSAIVLRYFEKRPFAEIGQFLDVSEDAAQKRVERAVAKLREAFGRRGISSTAGAITALLGEQAAVAAPAALAGTILNTAAGGISAAAAASGFMKAQLVLGVPLLFLGGSFLSFFGGNVFCRRPALRRHQSVKLQP